MLIANAITDENICPTHIAINPIGNVTTKIPIPTNFLKTSNRKNKSDRPFTCNRFKFNACTG